MIERKLQYYVAISRSPAKIGYEVYIYSVRGNDYHLVTIEKGKMKIGKEPFDPFSAVPLSESISVSNNDFLQAFADALGDIGIYPQATNKDKIKWEAVSDERKEQIEYLRELSEKIIFKG